MQLKQYIKYVATATLFSFSSTLFGMDAETIDESQAQAPTTNITQIPSSSQEIASETKPTQTQEATKEQLLEIGSKTPQNSESTKNETDTVSFLQNGYVQLFGGLVAGALLGGIIEGGRFLIQSKKKDHTLNNTDQV